LKKNKKYTTQEKVPTICTPSSFHIMAQQTITVVVLNMFRASDASQNAVMDQYLNKFEKYASKVVSFAFGSSIERNTITLVSSNNGCSLVERLFPNDGDDDDADNSSHVDLEMVEFPPELLPNNHHEAETCLHVLAAALGSLELFIPSGSKVNLLFLTPSFLTSHVELGATSSSSCCAVMQEIWEYLGDDNATVQSCLFMEIQSQHNHNSVGSPFTIFGFIESQKNLSFPGDAASSSCDCLTLKKCDLSDSSFKYICQQLLSWNYTAQPVVLKMQSFNAPLHDVTSQVSAGASTSMAIYCELLPTVFTNKHGSWLSQGFSNLKYKGVVSLTKIDALRLGRSYSVAPTSSSSPNKLSKLPLPAIRENRCVFASICEHLSANEVALVFECPSTCDIGGREATTTEQWILHCESSTPNMNNNEDSNFMSWRSAILQELVPQVEN
jgi:hypothetical protein